MFYADFLVFLNNWGAEVLNDRILSIVSHRCSKDEVEGAEHPCSGIWNGGALQLNTDLFGLCYSIARLAIHRHD